MERHASLSKYLNPWKFRREEAARQDRLLRLRERDGDNCQRCRRPLRFELPAGYDQAPKFYDLTPDCGDELLPPIESQVLVHARCNAAGTDNTAEVTERVRRKTEAELFSTSRKRA